MRVLAFAASLRAASLNRKLVGIAAEIARSEGLPVDLVDFREFEMPIYDGDVERRDGLPPGALRLVERIRAADALLISTPEYNFSIAGPLKNAIDWASRARPMPFRGKSVYLMSAAPSPMGGIRGLWQTRIPLEGCGAFVFPDMFALAHAGDQLEDGRLRDPALWKRFQTEITGFLRLAGAIRATLDGCDPGESKPRGQKIEDALEDQTELQPAGPSTPGGTT